MKVLVTGSAGHLGEALVRTYREAAHDVVGLDILESSFTTVRGSICERAIVKRAMAGVQIVLHAATLHKPHVGTHRRQDFIDVNVTGTLNLLEEAVLAGVQCFIYTSTTSVYGDALIPPAGLPAAWISEEVAPSAKNIYGATKMAAEDLCRLFARNQKLPSIVLRTSRFFPEPDDNRETREAYADENSKVNEYLHRRVDIEDVVSAHERAVASAQTLGFGLYNISATTPFGPEDLSKLRTVAPEVVRARVPDYEAEYARRGWRMFPGIDRVYVNRLAREELGWKPRHDFKSVIDRLRAGEGVASPLARSIGCKGYHAEKFREGPYPVE